MAERITKKRALELLNELATAKARHKALVEKRDAELQPLTASYQEACAPINSKYSPKLKPLADEIGTKEKALTDFLLTGFDEQTGAVALTQLEAEPLKDKQLVAVVKVGSSRWVDPEKFLAAVSERTAEFWACLTVGLQKAEAFIGKNRVADIARKKFTASVTFETRTVETPTE